MELYSKLGKEYAKNYNRSALLQIARWATTAEEGLRDAADNKRVENETTGKYAEDDDADFYSDFASYLLALVDENVTNS